MKPGVPETKVQSKGNPLDSRRMPSGRLEEAEVEKFVALVRLRRGGYVGPVPYGDPGPSALAFGVVPGT